MMVSVVIAFQRKFQDLVNGGDYRVCRDQLDV
jgi:hypothetical protein